MEFAGRWALVTGASSGIGEQVAREFARRRCSLVLVARRERRLRDLAAELRQAHGIEVDVEAVDLASPETARALYERVRRRGRPICYLVNNAGFGRYGSWIEGDLDSDRDMVQVNAIAPMELSRLFVQDIIQRGERGRILHIASVNALVPVPGYLVYGSTKAFLRYLGEIMRAELAPRGIGVTVLCPGPTQTEFFDVSGQPRRSLANRWLGMPAHEVAAIAIEAMSRNRGLVIAGWRNAILTRASWLLPRPLLRWVVGKVMPRRE